VLSWPHCCWSSGGRRDVITTAPSK
jgi:hypothetical protein